MEDDSFVVFVVQETGTGWKELILYESFSCDYSMKPECQWIQDYQVSERNEVGGVQGFPLSRTLKTWHQHITGKRQC